MKQTARLVVVRAVIVAVHQVGDSPAVHVCVLPQDRSPSLLFLCSIDEILMTGKMTGRRTKKGGLWLAIHV